jgi:putative peptidoglycan lipid II flippase
MRIGVAVMVLTQIFNAALVPWLGVSALTLSLSLASMVNAGWLLWGLKKLDHWRPAPGWGAFALRIVLACTVMGAGLVLASRRFDWLALGAHEAHRAAWLALIIAGAVLLYFGTLVISGMNLRQALRRQV